MFGSQIYDSVVVSLGHDPAADDIMVVWRAPAACEVKSAYAIKSNALAAGTANYFSLQLRNGGAAGTATTAISDEIGGTVGWAALTPVAFTMTTTGKNLAAGDVVEIDYDETGTGTFADTIVQLDIQYGT